MSAIRPPVPSPLFPTQTPAPAQSPVRASRSDFFKTALDAVQGAPVEAAAAVASKPAAAAPRWVEERLQRPGSLLDIRV